MSKAPQNPPVTVGRKELLRDGADTAFRQMLYDLQTVSVRMQSVRDEMAAKLGITGPQYNILMVIAHFATEKRGDDRQTGVTVKETAAHLHVSGAFVTGEVKKLMGVGLLEKRADVDDRRKVRLTLTEAAKARLETLAPSLRTVNDTFFRSLSAKDFQALTAVAAGLAESSGAAMELLEAEPTEDEGSPPLLKSA